MAHASQLRAVMFLAVVAIFGAQEATGQALCNRRWTGILCTACGGSGATPAYTSYWWGCVACFGGCPWYFGPESDGSDDKAEVAAPDPSGISRQLNISASQLREIASRNPWAASILISLVDIGELANINGATSYMALLPTVESVYAQVAGDIELAKSVATSAEIRGRVTHRLERGPGTSARLYMTSFVADEDERILYKPYPDVVLDLFEAPPSAARSETPGGNTQKIEREPGSVRSLIVQSWKVAE